MQHSGESPAVTIVAACVDIRHSLHDNQKCNLNCAELPYAHKPQSVQGLQHVESAQRFQVGIKRKQTSNSCACFMECFECVAYDKSSSVSSDGLKGASAAHVYLHIMMNNVVLSNMYKLFSQRNLHDVDSQLQRMFASTGCLHITMQEQHVVCCNDES